MLMLSGPGPERRVINVCLKQPGKRGGGSRGILLSESQGLCLQRLPGGGVLRLDLKILVAMCLWSKEGPQTN